MSPDDLRRAKDKEYEERMACRKDRIDLSRLRATDLPCCTDMKMPGSASIRDEIEIQGTRESYRSTSYQLTDAIGLVTTTKRVVYPDGRVFEVEEKKLAPVQE